MVFSSLRNYQAELGVNWINEKTDLQNAAKVRATNGLMVHIFGALVTALFHYIF